MTRILTLVIALLALPAAAQDRLSVLIGSHHAGASQSFEGRNPGLILPGDGKAADAVIAAGITFQLETGP